MERIVKCTTVKIVNVERIKSSYCTFASINSTDKIYVICECVEPEILDNTGFILTKDFYTFKVAIADLYKESNFTLNDDDIEILVKKLKKTLKNKILYLTKTYEITLRKENTFMGRVSGNYKEIYKKRISKKLINEIRRSLLGTHKVPSIDSYIDN